MKVFAPFSKIEEQLDGTIRVWGVASSESRDSDGEIIRAAAIRSAIPDFIKYGGVGALREMHQPIAAGVIESIDVGDDNLTRVQGHVVDPTSVLKVKNKVLRGFSIGGRVTKRSPTDPREILECEVVECSLVDRPANPDATITLWKADMLKDDKGAAFIADPPNMTGPVDATLVFTFANASRQELPLGTIHVEDGEPVDTADLGQAIEQIFEKRKFTAEERQTATRSGAAMPGGRYPIENKEDLHNAIRLVGRGKGSHAAIRRHIKSRAKALGLESDLPDDWKKLKKNGAGMQTVAHLAQILASIHCLRDDASFEQEMENDADSTQPEEIRAWLKSGADLLRAVVEEEAEELAMKFEGVSSDFARIKVAAEWMMSLSKARVSAVPKVGQKVSFDDDDGPHGGVIEIVEGSMVTARMDKGHLADIAWKGLDFDKAAGAWTKRGARLSKEVMGHLQSAHESLVKTGGVMCAAAEDEGLGKRVRALSPEMRSVVETMIKVKVEPAVAPPTGAAVAKAAGSEQDRAMNQANAASLSGAPDFGASLGNVIGREMSLAASKLSETMTTALDRAMAQMRKEVAGVSGVVASVSEKVNQLASDPAPAKGVTRLVSVTKGEDVAGRAAQAAAQTNGSDPLAAFKAAFTDENSRDIREMLLTPNG